MTLDSEIIQSQKKLKDIAVFEIFKEDDHDD